MDRLSRLKVGVEPYWIRLRESLGWALAVVAIGFVLLGAWGMVAPLAAPSTVSSAVGGGVGERLAAIARSWYLTIPVFAALAWFALKL